MAEEIGGVASYISCYISFFVTIGEWEIYFKILYDTKDEAEAQLYKREEEVAFNEKEGNKKIKKLKNRKAPGQGRP